MNFASSLSNEIPPVLHGLYPALYRGYATLRDAYQRGVLLAQILIALQNMPDFV